MSLTTTTALTADKRQRKPLLYSWQRFIKRNAAPYLFLTPFLVGFILFLVYPLIYAFRLSMYRNRLIGGITFVGLDNYVKAFQDKNFWEGVRNVLIFGSMQIPVM